MNYEQPQRPTWACLTKDDNFGDASYARLDEYTLVCFRWIRPGNLVTPTGTTPIEGFWLGETPVTQAQWCAVMGTNPSRFSGSNKPVECVNYDDTLAFCSKLSAKLGGNCNLPTESQWEYACRADVYKDYNNGHDCTQPAGLDPALDRIGWFDKNSEDQTHDVRQKDPNVWGLFDMHGNVWEWCRYISGLIERDANAGRVVRGGSWFNRAWGCRAASRVRIEPGLRRHGLGFRLAITQ